METVRFQKLSPRAAPPVYATEGAAGADLSACINSPITIKPMQRAKVPTGLALEIPRGFEGQVRPRSGLADRAGVTVLNAPGTIDADYRGEVQVLLVNLGSEDFVINHGDRIAQLVVAPAMRFQFEESALEKTARDSGGFGSTGV